MVILSYIALLLISRGAAISPHLHVLPFMLSFIKGGKRLSPFFTAEWGKSIVVSGDLSRLSELTEFAQDADIFLIDVMHPSAEDIGRTATEARVKTLVLPHIIYSWFGNELNLRTKIQDIRKYYDGEIVEAHDLMTFEL